MPLIRGGPAGRHRQRFGALLGAVIVVFGLSGVAPPSAWAQALTSLVLGCTLLLAFVTAEIRRRPLQIAVPFVVLLVALSVAEAVAGNVDQGATRIVDALLVLLAPPAVVLGVVRSLQARQAVTLEAVFGVLSVYVLVGMFFAYVYGTIERVTGSPFFAQGGVATISRCQYFSFTTLTTVGYGDLTARTNLGHTLSISESLVGQIYLVTVVSLIVGNLRRSRPSPAAPADASEPAADPG